MYFLNTEIQDNIRNSKEEQFQEGFLRELFVKVLGYTLNPSPNYNLITEQKNVSNAKKADGAILVNGEIVGVIELKDGKTTDLTKVEQQAFGYKNQHPKAVYVIISNFQKLRFYINNTIEYQEFDLFNLTLDDFKVLYLLLAYPQIENNIPKNVKEESLSSEDTVTKSLYKDYSAFKRALFADILENNEVTSIEDKILLFKKSQKLLDRLLFIFFAEDSGLLSPNTMIRIISDWEKLKELDAYTPLYERIKKYFNWLNEGYKGKDFEVFAYNGGLFKPDEVLDNLTISDDVLFKHTNQLSQYDYGSEVDVNILGHIFENSLTEIEEITNQLQEGVEPTVSKRKKDGVFYTPQYITKYIVENTVGKLCSNKKEELGIVEEEYFSDKKRQISTKKSLLDKLETYRDWLKGITICDPACGSGAFLSAALQFLKSEHQLINEMQAKVTGGGIAFAYFDNDILENNLYGVDINEESIEIAKLALWLRTAQPNRKLSSLNNNIKCGNSLISDPTIAGEKAFNWEQEFPEVFEKGGFDIVIGNPPYVQLQSMGKMSDIYAQCGYQVYNKSADLYCLFVERGYSILKEGGLQSYIMPNKWMLSAYGKELRRFLATTNLQQIINFGDVQFFEGAATIVCIFVTQKGGIYTDVQALSLNNKTYHGDFANEVMAGLELYPHDEFGDGEWSIQPRIHLNILKKMKNGTPLKKMPINIYRGILTGYNDAFYIDEKTRQQLITEDPKSVDLIKPLLRGRDILAWYSSNNEQYQINPHNGIQSKNLPPINIDEYFSIKQHLDKYYDKLAKRYDKGVTPYNLRHCDYIDDFSKPKIIYPNMTSVFPFAYDEQGYMGNDKTFIITAQDESINLKYLTAIFNSKLCKLWIWYNCPELLGGTREIRKVYFENFAIPDCGNQQEFIKLADLAITLHKELHIKRSRFLKRLYNQPDWENIKITSVLANFDTLTFVDFLKELSKQKIKLSLVQQDEWEEYFNHYKTECNELVNEITAVDSKIDELVYKLYNLTEEEIQVVNRN
jgi:tRNA1(Val) A37 N6-methylase TrmN6